MRVPYLLLVIIFVTYPSYSTAKEMVLWRVTDWPPFYILAGADKGTGLYDQMIQMLALGMPEYTHERISMNTDRVLLEMDRGTKVCHPSVLPNTDATLSVINSILLPHRIILITDSPGLAKLGDPTSLDILLADKWLLGGVTPRRYTDTLNEIVKKHAFREHLHNSPNYMVLIKELLHKRLDYIIEYPPIISYFARQLNMENNTTSLGIVETLDTPFLLVHIACPKTDWGRMMIAKIDNILMVESPQANFLDFRLQWFDESSRKLLQNYYEQHYFNDK